MHGHMGRCYIDDWCELGRIPVSRHVVTRIQQLLKMTERSFMLKSKFIDVSAKPF